MGNSGAAEIGSNIPVINGKPDQNLRDIHDVEMVIGDGYQGRCF